MAKVGKILLAVVQIAAIVAINYFAPVFGGYLSAALIAAVGTVAITLGGALLSNALFGKKIDMGQQKINVRLEEASRWNCAGPVMQGGAVVFAEHDAVGNLWWVIIHCDSIMTSTPAYYLDNMLVTVNGSGEVTTPEFTDKGTVNWTIKTYTYTESDPTPPAATDLAAAFPSLWPTVSHMLVGTTYSVVKGRSVKVEKRYKVYKWRGPLGLGEPNLAIFADWSNMYDPRDETQTLGDRTTYKPSRNAALIWAWWRTHPFGRQKSESEIEWDEIAFNADICDETVVGIESTQKRYECAIAAQDNIDKVTIETNIILASDGQIVFNDEGKSFLKVGYYYVPTLSLGRNRDIITMASVEAQDGESETQGVIVRYTDHNANHTIQPSAAWYNPNYYVSGVGNTFLKIDIPTCFNHNQAMRLAKSIGMRSQPTHKLGPTTGLRGLRAMQERIVNLVYDNEFAGDYEIISPVEVDESGMFCSLGLAPMDENRFDLQLGEEKPRPAATTSSSSATLDLPVTDTIDFVNNRIEITFEVPLRDDVTYEFQYIPEDDWSDDDADPWANMSVNMDALFAYSGSVDTTSGYYIRWRTVTAGGSSTDWYDPPYLLDAQGIIAPFELTATATDSDSVEVRYRQPRTLLLDYSHVLADETAVIGSAAQVGADQYGSPGEVVTITEDSIVAGPRSYWAVAFDDDGNDAAVGPVSINVGGFDFSGGSLPSGASLTRSGNGWYFNSSGVLTVAGTDVARFDHRWNGTSWVAAGVLVEPSRENRIRNSVAAGSTAGVMGSGGVAPTNWTFAGTGAGLTREIIGTGTEDGLAYIDVRISGTASNSGLVDFTFEALTQSAAVVTDPFAASIFAKLTGGSLAGLDSIKIGMIEYNSSSSSLATQLGGAIIPTAARQRFESTFTVGQATAAYTRMLLRIDTTVSVACDLTLRLYQPQFELGSGATSPIPTSGAKVTRNADTLVLDWSTNRHVPDGAMTTRYSFDDATTQDVATTVASGTATVPTTLNRHAILSAQKVS